MSLSIQAATFIASRVKNKNISFSEYKKLAEWLEAYDYIYPASRAVLPALGIALANEFNGNLTAAWHRYCDLETCTNQEVQKEILQWLSKN